MAIAAVKAAHLTDRASYPNDRESAGARTSQQTAYRYSLLELPFKVLFINSVQGTALVALALWMGAGPLVVSVLAASPFLGNVVSVLGPYALERTGTKRKLTQLCYCVAAALYLALPLHVLVGARSPDSLPWLRIALVVAVLLAEMIRAMADVAYLAWLAEIFPPEQRGRYFARRFVVMAAGNVVTTLAIGQYLSLWGSGRDLDPIAFYTLIPAGVVAMFAAIWLQRNIPGGTGRDLPTAEPGLRGLLGPLFDPMYRGFLIARALQAITYQLVGPFLVVFMIVDLKLPYSWVFALQVLYQGTAVISYRVWERATARIGPRRVFIINSIMFVLFPAFFAASGFGGLWVLVPAHLFGFFEGGFALSQQLLMMNLAPEKRQIAYIGTANAVTGTLFGVATIAGGLLVQPLGLISAASPLSPIGSGLPALMLLSIALRILVLPALRLIKDVPVRPVQLDA